MASMLEIWPVITKLHIGPELAIALSSARVTSKPEVEPLGRTNVAGDVVACGGQVGDGKTRWRRFESWMRARLKVVS